MHKMKTEKAEENDKSRSQRKYPERVCFNLNCEFQKKFIPYDRRQKFCCEQCRINYYNDQRHINNTTVLLKLKKLKQIDDKLANIYKRFLNKDGKCLVRREILFYENIDVMLMVRELENKQTKGKVKAYLRFGIELLSTDDNYYLIHKLVTTCAN
jgi:hypothetical protein